MNVTFRCPYCNRLGSAACDDATTEITCPGCSARWPVATGSIQGGKVAQCVICPSTELFIRKDFSQGLGVAIVAIGFLVSSVFWYYRMPMWTYGVLFLTALIDVVLYFLVGNLLQCYRCQAQYRGALDPQGQEPFDLETHEKHR